MSETNGVQGLVRIEQSNASGVPLAVREEWDDSKRALLANTIAKGATQDELDLFIAVCQRTGLDPFLKQIYFVKYGGKVAIQVGVDGYRALAERTGRYGGQIGPEWCDAGGDWHDVWLEDVPPSAARVGIIRKDWDKPVFATCRFKSYVKPTDFWRDSPDNMIAKCAESLAFRKAFPTELGRYAPRPAELDATDRFVDEDGVIHDETPALASGGRSAKAQALIDEVDAAVAEGAARPTVEPDAVGATPQEWEDLGHEPAGQPVLLGGEDGVVSPLWPEVQRLAAALTAAAVTFTMPPATQSEDFHREWIARMTRALRAKQQPAARR